jgi:hypothetical protein
MSKANRDKGLKARQQRIFESESEKLLGNVLVHAIDNPHGKIFATHSTFCEDCARQMVARTQLLLKGFGYENRLEFVPSKDSGGVK